MLNINPNAFVCSKYTLYFQTLCNFERDAHMCIYIKPAVIVTVSKIEFTKYNTTKE